MAPIPVLSQVPEVPRGPGDDITPANQWAFRSLMFYAAPVHLSPPQYANPWAIRLAQVHIKYGEWRFLHIHFVLAAGGAIRGIGVALLRPIPDEFVAELKFWATPFYELNVDSDKVERKEYTHHDLMRHLRDLGVQKQLFANLPGAPVHAANLLLWRNLVNLFVDLRIIEPDSVQTYDTKTRTRFN